MHEENKHSKYQDLLQAIFGLFFLILLCISPYQIDLDVPYPFYKGPLLVPMLVLSMGVLASIPACVRLIKNNENAHWFLDGEGFPKIPFALFILAILFVTSIFYFGLEASTLVFLSIMLKFLGLKNIYLLVALPICFALFFWFLFKFTLDLYFPTPEILYLLNLM